MADILQMMIEFLRINCQTVNCYFPNPFEGLFYLILLPMVVLIAFVYIIFSVSRIIEHKGIKLLIALVVLVFIILQGWFNFFIVFSWIWVIIIIIMGIWWSIRRGGGGKMPSLGGKMTSAPGGIASRVKGITKGYSTKMSIARDQLSNMESIANSIRQTATSGGNYSDLHSSFLHANRELTETLKEASKEVETFGGFGPDLRREHDHIVDRKKEIVEDLSRFLRSNR